MIEPGAVVVDVRSTDGRRSRAVRDSSEILYVSGLYAVTKQAAPAVSFNRDPKEAAASTIPMLLDNTGSFRRGARLAAALPDGACRCLAD